MPARKTTTARPVRKPRGGPRTYGRLQQALDETARREIASALKMADGNVSEAARVLGIHRVSLVKRMKALGLDPQAFR